MINIDNQERRMKMKIVTLHVEGMVCEGCENRIQKALKTLEEVKEVSASHTTGVVSITLEKDIDEKILIETIEDIGYDVKEG